MGSSSPRVIICLLRNDLRIHDNEVLLWAHRNADHVVPLYCFDPRHYVGTHHYSFPKTGPCRLKFLLESIKELRRGLKEKGSNLLLRRGKPEDAVEELVTRLGSVTAVALQQEVTKEELDVENAVKQVCSRHGVQFQTFWGSTLYHRDDLPFRHISRLPDVYTQFRKAVEAQCQARPTLQMPDRLKPLPDGLEEEGIPTQGDFGQENPVTDPRSAFPCAGGETQALQRLQYYFWDANLVASYKDTRNGLIGADYSTKFAPWLALGCISPRYIYEQIKKYERERTANQSTYWVVFELLWRDYFRFVALKYGRRIFFLRGLQDTSVLWKTDPKLFDAWKEGRTGVPFVDANMRELAATGFMSNRGRQNVASFLTKDLWIDWRMGAEWFEYLLGDYVRMWVPELRNIKGGDVHTPWALSNASLVHAGVTLGETYPLPIVMAPEWSRHINQKPASGGTPPRRGRGPSHTPKQHRNRGIDFYFSRNKDV
uniref:Cryptochrome DASH n=1 Tax=Leptobrachium leishanense TaxID=445787 RepID=A0A8C5QHK3_9ANUR